MSNIVAQMNPTALIAVAALLVLSFLSIVVLRLVRKGRAKNPGDLVQIARERAAAAKETKAATKRAEAAIAAPVAASRLSRISAGRENDAAPTEQEPSYAYAEPSEFGHTDDALMAASDENLEEVDELIAPPPFVAPIIISLEPGAEKEPAIIDDSEAEDMESLDDSIDLGEASNHPTDWDGLIAMVDRLDAILAMPWNDEAMTEAVHARLDAARAAAGDDAGDDLHVRALSRDVAAIELARTINNAAREQASEIVAAVREFAHQQEFSPEDCGAVMQALQQIEWMALIKSGDRLEKRTMPLTVHDPAAPLWVADAREAMREARQRRAA